MSSKSSALTLLYVLVGTVLVCAYCYLYQGDKLAALMPMHAPPDVFISLLVGILALIAIAMGAHVPIVAITSTLGIFVTLTLAQSDPIRYMTLAALLFCIGFYGFASSRNAVRVLMSIELMLNAVNINLVTMARYVDPGEIRGQVFAIFILTVAAAEAAVGLAIVLAIYRTMSTVDMEKFTQLKG